MRLPVISITGASGMMGQSIVRNMSLDYHIYAPSSQIRLDDKIQTNAYFQQLSEVDILIHAAAKVGGVLSNSQDNDGYFNINNAINRNVLDAAFRNKYDKVISVLSTCIFPDKTTYPLVSENIDNGTPNHTNKGYAYSKRLLMHSTKYMGDMLGKEWGSIIPTNLYGIKDNFNLQHSHVIPALIHKAYIAKKTGGYMEVLGNPDALRQFLFIDDFSQILKWSLDSWDYSKEPLMAVNETEYPISYVAETISDIIGLHASKISYNPKYAVGQFRKPAKSSVSDHKFTPLKEGLETTIEWFINNYETCRK